jgi:hypothetical protein
MRHSSSSLFGSVLFQLQLVKKLNASVSSLFEIAPGVWLADGECRRTPLGSSSHNHMCRNFFLQQHCTSMICVHAPGPTCICVLRVLFPCGTDRAFF